VQVEVLAFGPGLNASGRRGTLAVDASSVQLHTDGVASGAPLAQVELREVGFGRPGVELAWTDGEHRWAAHVLDPDAAARLLAAAPLAALPQARQLHARRTRLTAGRALGASVVAAIVLLPVLLLALVFWQSERLAGWAIGHVSVDTEVRLGRTAFEDLRAELDLQKEGPAFDAVQSLGGRLATGSKYRYEFHVARDAAVNAFALPGGIVVVNTGLIAATKRPEELAGVLAHEIQHVEQRHSLENAAKALGLRAAWALATGDVGGTLAGEAALQLTTLRFSREAEEEADAGGFALLVQRGIDPSGMQSFFETLHAKAEAAPPELLSTHPASDSRSEALAAKIAALGGRRFEPLPYTRWPPE
jgi:Zn-dependent protease with chaperone function